MTAGRCVAAERGLECRLKVPCWFCARWSGDAVDDYYLAKVAAGLVTEPVEEVLTEREIKWTMSGRLHGDGRRSDQYVDKDLQRQQGR